MHLKIEMNCDNAAFADNPYWEAGRILQALAKKLVAEEISGAGMAKLRDVNGNTVGHCTIEED